jgi:hypothetical protein
MKLALLVGLLLLSLFSTAQVNSLPAGRYETAIKDKPTKWEKGDIIILDDSHYKITSTNETGEFRFSATAQRIFFTSGPLKSLFAKTVQSGDKPAIIFPTSENEQLGFKIASADVWGYYRN